MKPTSAPRRREPTIALINIVFLMLIFFMAAATLAPPLSREVTLVRTQELEGRAPPDALVVHADGRLEYRGQPVTTPAAHLSALPEPDRRKVRIVPDAELPAPELIRLGAALRAAGAERVTMVTERGLE